VQAFCGLVKGIT